MEAYYYRLIAQQKRKEVYNRKIAESLNLSRNTVNKIVNFVTENNIPWSEIQEMSNQQLHRLFSSRKTKKRDEDYAFPDYENLAVELAVPGVTFQLLWEEYVDQCRLEKKKAYQPTQFKKYFNEYLSKTSFSDIVHHKAGERVEVDWAGKRPHWSDLDTGEIQYGYLFVGVLSFSGLVFAKVCADMKLPNWIQCHIDMFEYFGGVPQILTPDNLRTGISKHTKEAIVLNPAYEDMAEHYGIVVIPTRVRTPKDKPLVENSVGKLTTQIIARLRNYQFFSIDEYNEQLMYELDRINNKPFQKKEGSRRSVFETFEKNTLHPLPSHPYEICEWKKAKVQSNSHISVQKCFYSVPYEYLGKEVSVKMTRDLIEIYYDKEKLCEHQRTHNKVGAYQTNPAHMPPYSNQYGEWNSTRYLNWAKKKGPHTYEVIYRLFKDADIEQKYYRAAHSILKLADTYSDQRLESACKCALELFQRPSYKNVKNILKSGEDLRQAEKEENKTSSRFLRGGHYFGN